MPDRYRIRIAIVGGGIAGAALANSLVQIDHLEVHIFESAPQFSERGAAVGLSVNSQNALSRVLNTDAKSMLLGKAGGVPMNSTRIMMGAGPSAGSLVFNLSGTYPGIVVHRASILRELLAPLPKHILHANKKLATIRQDSDKIDLEFSDGMTEQFDAVIGADGIFSTVRQHVLEDAGKNHDATPAGFWDCRNLVPFNRAKKALGEQYFELDRQYGWVGPGALVMHDILENRTMVQCVVSGVEIDPPPDRKRPLTRDYMLKALEEWPETSVAKGMIDLMLDQPDPQGYSEWEHKSTPTYSRGSVCIMGDAAHAMTPWQGSGAGQAIEDAMILGTLLKQVDSPSQIEAAFEAYSIVRRPRCQKIIDSSRGTGGMLCGQNVETGLDPDKLKAALGPRWAFIYSLDMEQHKKEALDKFHDILAGD
uniref:PesA n=1 Tax=Pestalotiopsis humus TaxID=1562279 RepID=A0A6M4ELJ7_9PEZI|nr:PesA [Pestalotiopsis humus]